MLTIKVTDCSECPNICDLINLIDCKISESAKFAYNNSTLLLNNKVDEYQIIKLINYKRILTYKMFNSDYLFNYSLEAIATKIRKITSGCINKCSECNLSKSTI